MKIAIANDMKLACELLNNLLQKKTKHKIIWTACDGQDAVEKCLQNRPDILLMDLLMPKLNGAEATKEIMRKAPCAILVVTANVAANVSLVFEAMGNGALDVVKTPSFDLQTCQAENDDLLKKIEMIASLIESCSKEEAVTCAALETALPSFPVSPFLLIGASTGGPIAIRRILSSLGSDFPYTTVILQHLDQEFAEGLVSWLQEESPLKVHLAESGQELNPGEVYVAGKNCHLVLTPRMRLNYLSEGSFSHLLNKPSIDIFFNSVANISGLKGIACLLTGMGSDGAQGLFALKNAGFETIIEDSSTAVVYGMPRAAREMGAQNYSLPIDLIGPKIREIVEMKLSPAGNKP